MRARPYYDYGAKKRPQCLREGVGMKTYHPNSFSEVKSTKLAMNHHNLLQLIIARAPDSIISPNTALVTSLSSPSVHVSTKEEANLGEARAKVTIERGEVRRLESIAEGTDNDRGAILQDIVQYRVIPRKHLPVHGRLSVW